MCSFDEALLFIGGFCIFCELIFIGGLLVTFGSSGPGKTTVPELFYTGIGILALDGVSALVILVYCFIYFCLG